jgi:hypothetical protein
MGRALVGNCPSALRVVIEAGLRPRPRARPDLAELAHAARQGAAAAAPADSWQTPDVPREIEERGADAARLRMALIDREAPAPPRSVPWAAQRRLPGHTTR